MICVPMIEANVAQASSASTSTPRTSTAVAQATRSLRMTCSFSLTSFHPPNSGPLAMLAVCSSLTSPLLLLLDHPHHNQVAALRSPRHFLFHSRCRLFRLSRWELPQTTHATSEAAPVTARSQHLSSDMTPITRPSYLTCVLRRFPAFDTAATRSTLSGTRPSVPVPSPPKMPMSSRFGGQRRSAPSSASTRRAGILRTCMDLPRLVWVGALRSG
jgi:hypothetical protein